MTSDTVELCGGCDSNLDCDGCCSNCDTRPIWEVESFPTRETWLAARRTVIGSSDAASLFEAEIVEQSKGEERPFKSRLGLYADKVGASEDLDLSSVPRVAWGNRLEGSVADAFCELTGAQVIPIAPFTLYRRRDLPMTATPDRLLAGSPARILECKTAGAEQAKHWGEDGDPEGVPLRYSIQVQHQLAVMDLPRAHLAVLIGGNDFRTYEIEADADFRSVLERRVREFWRSVELREAPEPGPLDLDVVRSLYRKASVGKSVRIQAQEADALLDEYELAKQIASDASKQADTAKARLMALLGDAEEGVLPSGRSLLWRATVINHKARPAVEAWTETTRRFRTP